MGEKVNGSFYIATIEKSNVVALDGTPLNFKVDIYCEEEILFKELIEHIGRFHNDRLNFNYEDLFIASKNILDDELHISGNNNIIFEDYSIPEIKYKMNKNDLTNISESNIINGIAQQHIVENFFTAMTKEDPLFFDKINNSLKNCYTNLNKKFSGDLLFFSIYEHFKNGLTETQRGACLAIIVYFFTICELFEK